MGEAPVKETRNIRRTPQRLSQTPQFPQPETEGDSVLGFSLFTRRY